MSFSSQFRLPVVAYHEAGHAFLAYVLDHDMGIVDIIPRKGRLGVCMLPVRGWITPRSYTCLYEEHILAIYAGPVAEKLYTRSPAPSFHQSDVDSGWRLSSYYFPDMDQRGVYVDSLQFFLEDALTELPVRVALEAGMRALLARRRLSARQMQRVFRETLPRARKERLKHECLLALAEARKLAVSSASSKA